jgi:hypothetical protein
MKRFFGFALMLSLLAAPAFAGKKAQTLVISEKVMVGTTAVPAGTYKVTYEGTGPTVQVTLSNNQKSVATFPAKVVAGKNNNGVTTDTRNGVETVLSIQLSDVSLQIQGGSQAGQ